MRGMISQPRYLPTFNYLQRIYQSDIFVVLDDVQHQRRCVEHRNKIIYNDEIMWLSIPMVRTNTSRPLIKDLFFHKNFIDDHNKKIHQAYLKCNFYDETLYKKIYDFSGLNFVEFFVKSLKNTFEYFGLVLPKIIFSSSISDTGYGSKKLANICKSLGINEYISGPNGRDYLNLLDFQNTKVLYHDYEFPSYTQNSIEFVPWLCWLDGYFNEGGDFVKLQITKLIGLINV